MTSWGWGPVLRLRPKRKSAHEIVVPGRGQDVGKDRRQGHSSNGRWVWRELRDSKRGRQGPGLSIPMGAEPMQDTPGSAECFSQDRDS